MLRGRCGGAVCVRTAALVGWALFAALESGGEVAGMQQPPEIAFTLGPALSSMAAAQAHLARVGDEAPPRRVRLPVALTLDKERLAIVEARLGRGAHAPRVRLDDGRLGISVLDRARDLCPKDERCVLRLVGYWRGTSAGVGRLDVLRVDGRAQPSAPEFVEVEGPSGQRLR